MTDAARTFAAVDLGAESGRVIVGRLTANGLALSEAHRFANTPVALPDGLHWNPLALFEQMRAGLAKSVADGPLSGIGIDAWGVDYGLLDRGHRLLGIPFHYRDPRTEGMIELAGRRVPTAELYARTGIQTMPINTIFQLRAEATGAAVSVAERIALIPDLIALWLTGTLANEETIASTTGLLEAHGRRWGADLVGRLGLPRRPFAGEVTPPGVQLGTVLDAHSDTAGAAAGVVVRTVAGHDTASAFAAAPLSGPHGAVLSSGTWSLLGVELSEPELGLDASGFNLTNERGINRTTRLLRNVMGLWLVQECRRAWRAAGTERDYDELQTLARNAPPHVPVFDPDHDTLLRGGDMPARIAELLDATGQPALADRGELLRSILVSLACKYRLVTEQLERVADRRIDTIHVVGGGARNQLLCQLTADLLDRPVLAGPVEATALGNVLVQALALGELADLADVRRVAARSVSLQRFEPDPSHSAQDTYQRFLTVTGLTVDRAVRTPA